MYALVEIKGKQYKAEENKDLLVDLLDTEEGKEIEFDKVLMLSNGEKTAFGTPYVDAAKVKAIVGGIQKGKKIRVFKYKKRKNYRRTQGHRQQSCRITVNEVIGSLE